MSLSIFSFEKRDIRPSQAVPVRAGWQESASSVAVLDDPREQQNSRDMLLDLEHLTPETIEKFFPSEASLAASGR